MAGQLLTRPSALQRWNVCLSASMMGNGSQLRRWEWLTSLHSEMIQREKSVRC
jgi:hypothetical protein